MSRSLFERGRAHAIERRIHAEAHAEDFRPSPGRVTGWEPPQGPNIRLDSHCHAGCLVPPYHDSMIGKLIVYGADREEALQRMRQALARFRIGGIGTTLEFPRHVMADLTSWRGGSARCWWSG